MATTPNTSPVRPTRSRKQQLVRLVVSGFIWLGAAILYYFAFSIFVDTPMEYELKHQADHMKQEYQALESRYDTLMLVLENLAERDRAVFRSLFESDPYNFDTEETTRRDETYEAIFNRSTRRLKRDMRDRTAQLEKQMESLNASYQALHEAILEQGEGTHNIPSIQPVINKQLTDALALTPTDTGAAVDVVSTEPIRADNPLLGLENCLITPHIAWAPKESRQRLMDVAVSNLDAFLKGEPVNNVAM